MLQQPRQVPDFVFELRLVSRAPVPPQTREQAVLCGLRVLHGSPPSSSPSVCVLELPCLWLPAVFVRPCYCALTRRTAARARPPFRCCCLALSTPTRICSHDRQPARGAVFNELLRGERVYSAARNAAAPPNSASRSSVAYYHQVVLRVCVCLCARVRVLSREGRGLQVHRHCITSTFHSLTRGQS